MQHLIEGLHHFQKNLFSSQRELFERLARGQSPETLIEKFQKLAAAGATHISNWMMFGGIEHEKLMRSIRLMGEEVIPALREVGPSPDLAHELLAQPMITNEELQTSRLARAPRDMAT